MAQVPPALTGWLRGQYPTLKLDATWLEDCIAYLTTHFENQTAQQLIQRVHEQLILSDLKDSVEPSGPLAALQDAEHGFDLSTTRGVLVQILAITDIGHSAIALRDAHQKRKEERAGGPVVVGNVEEEQQQGPTKFPRSMLSLQLSDGYTTLKGIEYEKLPFLELGEMQLGSKLLLKGCRVRRGVALLTPQTAIWKKGSVQEFEEVADQQLLDSFATRLEAQNAPRPQRRAAAAPARQKTPARQAAPRQAAPRQVAPAVRAQAQDMDVDEDEDLLGDDLDLELADLDEPPRQAPERIVPRLDLNSDDDVDLFAGDEIWPEAEVKGPIGASTRTAITLSSSQ